MGGCAYAHVGIKQSVHMHVLSLKRVWRGGLEVWVQNEHKWLFRVPVHALPLPQLKVCAGTHPTHPFSRLCVTHLSVVSEHVCTS